MSRGQGRAERWLLAWLAEQEGGEGWFVWWAAEAYAAEFGQDAPAARATIRRAARRLAEQGLVETGHSVPLDRRRGRRSMWVRTTKPR